MSAKRYPDCDRVLVGEGRECSGRCDDHRRETLKAAGS